MSQKLARPQQGHLYHGVYPGKHDGVGDDVWPEDLDAYEKTLPKKTAWVYFSNEWSRCRLFPRDKCEWIRSRGAVPFIRLMLRGFLDQADVGGCRSDPYRLDWILRGDFDEDLMEWGRAVASYGHPLLVEYGTECNIKSFCWNGIYNGKGNGKGPDKFINAYCQVHEVIRKALVQKGATDRLTWVFHVNAGDDPGDSWNQFEHYYPGSDFVDWIGVSVYGAQNPDDKDAVESFSAQMDRIYGRLQKMDSSKPVIVAEFGCVDQANGVKAGDWAREAIEAMLDRVQNDWKNMIGFSWWNSRWRNDWDASVHDPATDSNMLVQENQGLLRAFGMELANARIDAQVAILPNA